MIQVERFFFRFVRSLVGAALFGRIADVWIGRTIRRMNICARRKELESSISDCGSLWPDVERPRSRKRTPASPRTLPMPTRSTPTVRRSHRDLFD